MLSYIKDIESKVEAVEAQKKKDQEKAEALRKKDQARRERDLSGANDRTHKFKMDLEGKIECIERRATERDLVQKQADEATKRCIESLAEDIEATMDFLAICLLCFRSFNLVFHISI